MANYIITHESKWQDRFYNSFFKHNCSQLFQLFGFVCQILTISIWQLRGYGRLSTICFLCGIAMLCISSFYAIAFRDECHNQFNKNTVFILILNGLSLFLLLQSHGEVVGEIGALREFLLLIGLFLVVCCFLFQLLFTSHFIKPSRTEIVKIIILTSLCIFFSFILNIECFNTWVRWDSYQYFHEIQDLSICNIFLSGDNGLKVCGHISSSYVLFSFLFVKLPGLSVLNGLYLSNMVLMAVDFLLYYKIFKFILPKARSAVLILYASVLVCIPSIFGNVAYFNAEHLLLSGALLLIYSILYNNNVLSVFAVFTLCYARENGAPFAAALLFIQFAYFILDDVNCASKKRVTLLYYIFIACVFVAWVLQYFSGHWAMGGSGSKTLMPDSNVFNAFGISFIHIRDTLFVGLLANGRWIFSVCILLGIVFLIVCLIRKQVTWKYILSQRGIVLVATGAGSFLAVLLIYVTYSFERYFVTFAGLQGVLGLCSLYYLFHYFKERRLFHFIVVIFIGAFMLGESYITIDPVTIATYPTISTGDATLAVTPLHTNTWADGVFAEHSCINRQVMYFEKAMDKAYASIYEDSKYGNTKVLCSDEYRVTSSAGSLLMIWGYGYTYFPPYMWGEWNSEGQYRYLTYTPNENKIIDPSYVLADSDLSKYTQQFDHVYYIEMPWGDTVIGPLMSKYPEIEFFNEVHYRGWRFNIYCVK